MHTAQKSASLPDFAPSLHALAQVLGRGGEAERASNLSSVLDGYFANGGHHINVNVLNRSMLMDAVEVGNG